MSLFKLFIFEISEFLVLLNQFLFVPCILERVLPRPLLFHDGRLEGILLWFGSPTCKVLFGLRIIFLSKSSSFWNAFLLGEFLPFGGHLLLWDSLAPGQQNGGFREFQVQFRCLKIMDLLFFRQRLQSCDFLFFCIDCILKGEVNIFHHPLGDHVFELCRCCYGQRGRIIKQKPTQINLSVLLHLYCWLVIIILNYLH